MKVNMCVVKAIPHFIPLVHYSGVVYPIRILLDGSDACAIVDPSTVHNDSLRIILGGLKSSYVDVVRNQKNTKRYGFAWRRRRDEGANVGSSGTPSKG